MDTSEPASSFDAAVGTLVLTPDAGTAQGTRYAVEARVEDAGGKFKITQDLYLIVYRGTNSVNMEEEKFLIAGLLDRTKKEFGAIDKPEGASGKKKTSPWAGKNMKIKGVDSTFLAKIHRIDELGQVLVKFTKPVVKVENLT